MSGQIQENNLASSINFSIHTLARKAAAILGIVALLAAVGRFTLFIPGIPAPFTLQTLVVGLAGIILGPRLASISVTTWLIAGLAGVPVFSEGLSGISVLLGYRAGYLLAMPFGAAIAGWLHRFAYSTWLAIMASCAIVLISGATVLSISLGCSEAIQLGIAPFLITEGIKCVLGTVLLKPRLVQRIVFKK